MTVLDLSETPSEYQMHGIGVKPAASKKFKLKRPDGSIHSQHDSEHEAMQAWSSHPSNKGMKITRESEELDDEVIFEEEGCSTASMPDTTGFGGKGPAGKMARRKKVAESVEPIEIGDKVSIVVEGFTWGRVVERLDDGRLVVDDGRFGKDTESQLMIVSEEQVKPYISLKEELELLMAALVAEAESMKNPPADDEEDDEEEEDDGSDDSSDSSDSDDASDADDEETKTESVKAEIVRMVEGGETLPKIRSWLMFNHSNSIQEADSLIDAILDEKFPGSDTFRAALKPTIAKKASLPGVKAAPAPAK